MATMAKFFQSYGDRSVFRIKLMIWCNKSMIQSFVSGSYHFTGWQKLIFTESRRSSATFDSDFSPAVSSRWMFVQYALEVSYVVASGLSVMCKPFRINDGTNTFGRGPWNTQTHPHLIQNAKQVSFGYFESVSWVTSVLRALCRQLSCRFRFTKVENANKKNREKTTFKLRKKDGSTTKSNK